MTSSKKRFFSYIFIFLTGFSALLYQTIWVKYLTRLTGSSSFAIAFILAVFLAGLSIGYYIFGKISTRTKNCIRLFGLLEGIIGIWGIFFPFLYKLTYRLTLSWTFSPGLDFILQGTFCTIVLTGLPTVLMGCTIPLLTKGFSNDIEESACVIARIYSINSFGAFAGVGAGGFLLIPFFGLNISLVIAGLLNIFCGIFFFFSGKNQILPEKDIEKNTNSDPQMLTGKNRTLLYVIAFICGFAMMSLENVMIRLCNLCLGSNAYCFPLIVCVFLFSISLGSMIISKFKKIPDSLLYFSLIFASFSIVFLFLILDSLPYLMHLIRISFQSNIFGFIGFYKTVFLFFALILFIPISLTGAVLPLIYQKLKTSLTESGKISGTVLVWNTLGNVLGCILGGYLFYYFFNSGQIVLIAAMLLAFSSCMTAISLDNKFIIVPVALLMLILFLTFEKGLYKPEHFLLGQFKIRNEIPVSTSGPTAFFNALKKNSRVIFHDIDPSANVDVIDHKSEKGVGRAIYINGKSDSSTLGDRYTLKLSAHIPALLSKKHDNVLVIGLGTGITAGELTLYPEITHIDIVEILPGVIKAVKHFKLPNQDLLNNQKVQIIKGDALRIISRSRKKWNIIISEPSNIYVNGNDILFSSEFIDQAKSKLEKGGVFLQWFHTYSANTKILGSVLNTLKSKFRSMHVFMSDQNELMILCSDSKIETKTLFKAVSRFNQNELVKRSLLKIGISQIDSILAREIFTTDMIKDSFNKYPIESLQHPKLHFLAIIEFFTGNIIPTPFLNRPESSFYVKEFLLARLYSDWLNHSYTANELESIITGLKTSSGNNLPAIEYLKVKNSITNPLVTKLTNTEIQQLGIPMIPIISKSATSKIAWEKIGCKNWTLRQKLKLMVDHIENVRHWIIPYPLDGFMEFLDQGIIIGKTDSEKNLCIIVKCLLLMQQKVTIVKIKELVKSLKKENGQVITEFPLDKLYLKTLNKKLTK